VCGGGGRGGGPFPALTLSALGEHHSTALNPIPAEPPPSPHAHTLQLAVWKTDRMMRPIHIVSYDEQPGCSIRTCVLGPAEELNEGTGISSAVFYGVELNKSCVVKWANDQGYTGVVQVGFWFVLPASSDPGSVLLRQCTAQAQCHVALFPSAALPAYQTNLHPTFHPPLGLPNPVTLKLKPLSPLSSPSCYLPPPLPPRHSTWCWPTVIRPSFLPFPPCERRSFPRR
jgi:hypothetical protein